MTLQRQLIVNADDFGLSPGVNRGVIEAHEHGIVTSASLMVRWPAAAEAAAYGRARSNFSLGLHVDLGEWIYRNETWVPLYTVVSTGDAAAVAQEVSHQLAAFRRLVGCDPTHLDSHQRVHSREPARSIMLETAGKLGVPLRHFTPSIHHCGDFYGQTAYGDTLPGTLTVDSLTAILAALPPGLTEMGCHPAVQDDFEAMYRCERAQEVQVLCDPRVRTAIAEMGILLRSFDDTRREGQLRTLLEQPHE